MWNGQWVRRSATAAAWPSALCDRILKAAEKVLTMGSADGWPYMLAPKRPVKSSACEENLRHELNRHSMSGARYDFVTFEGEARQTRDV